MENNKQVQQDNGNTDDFDEFKNSLGSKKDFNELYSYLNSQKFSLFKIDAPNGVSILLKTYANTRAWCIGRLTPLHTFATHHDCPGGDDRDIFGR